jgi:predicted lysophospholipase L1 biosynthesis ABC-type transport system permease subunit
MANNHRLSRKRLSFYLKYALRSLRRERQRSLFAAFCVAVGVGAVVAMQSLGLVVTDALSENVKAVVGGDIVLTPRLEPYDEEALAAFARLKDEGKFEDYTVTIETENAEIKKREADYSQMYIPRRWFVDPQKYPLYGQLEASHPKDVPVAQLLVEPYDVVVSDNVYDILDLALGDEVVFFTSRVTQPFTVKGVVPAYVIGDMDARLSGFVILRYERAAEMLDPLKRWGINRVYVKTASDEQAQAVLPQVRDIAPFTQVITAVERDQDLEKEARLVRQLSLMAGLLSLLIGGVGVANTTLVIAGRHLREMAILKSLGLKGRQVVGLFLAESGMLGLLGSLAGVLLGLAAGYGVKGLAERFLGLGLGWRVYPLPVLSGLLVGLATTVVFGFLPALAVSRVRPALVLQREEGTLPRLGRLSTGLVIFLLTGAMGLLAGLLVGDPSTGSGRALLSGLALAYGTLVALTLLISLLWVLVHLLARLPSMGRVNLKLALRGLTRQRGRTATTLLALSVGIFVVGLITVVADNVKALVLVEQIQKQRYNVVVAVPRGGDAVGAQQAIEAAPGFQRISPPRREVAMQLTAINGDADYLEKHLQAALEGDFYVFDFTSSINGWRLAEDLPEVEIQEGRNLTAADEGKDVVLVSGRVADALEIRAGDVLNIEINEMPLDLTVIGVQELSSFGLSVARVVPPTEPSSFSARFQVQFAEGEVEAAVRQLRHQLPGVIVLNISALIGDAFSRLVNQFALFPAALVALSLFAGVAIIANSVGLAVLERRREMGIMKALGAKSRQVLWLMLLENGLVGLVGGGIGIGLAVAGTLALSRLAFEQPARLNWLTIGGLLALAVAIPLGATLVSGWGAVREKPLVVLRYE